jgi:hypothetical protein
MVKDPHRRQAPRHRSSRWCASVALQIGHRRLLSPVNNRMKRRINRLSCGSVVRLACACSASGDGSVSTGLLMSGMALLHRSNHDQITPILRARLLSSNAVLSRSSLSL